MTGCPGLAGPSATSAWGSFRPDLAGAPFPEGAMLLGWPKPARCPAGWKNRQGSRADAQLPRPGGAFRYGQSTWGSSRPALAGAPFSEGTVLRGRSRPTHCLARWANRQGMSGRPSTALRSKRRGFSALPFPCGSEFQIAVSLFMVGEIRPRYRGKALKKGTICCIYKILYELYLKIRRKRPLLHPLCRSGAEEWPFCRQSTGRGETFSERRRTRPSPEPGGRRP